MLVHRCPPALSFFESLPSFVLAGLSVLAMSVSFEARADSVQRLTFIEVRSDAASSAAVLLRQYAQAMTGKAPATTAHVLQQIDRPEHFVILEESDRPGDLLEHGPQAQPNLLQTLATLQTAPLDRRTHRSFVAPCPSEPPDTAPAAHERIYVIAHLDIAGPVSEAPRAALEHLAAAACRAPGNESFDVWQQLDRGNHFNLVSRWSSRQALGTFAASSAAREFRATMGPRLGSPYDERLYEVR